MLLKQTSFDFFDMTPDNEKPEEEYLSAAKGQQVVLAEADLEQSPQPREKPEADVVVEDNNAKSTEKTANKSTRGRIKLSDMDELVALVDVPEDEILYQKRYYPISVVSKMFNVNISLIRFWENEFSILKPRKNGKGDRLFRPEDIKNLQLIYHLLREKKYTIDGAKDFLKKNKHAEEIFELIDSLKKTKAFLLELKANL